MKIQDFIADTAEVLINIRQAHHLTFSDPQHRLLGEFYDKWSDLSDSFIETHFGKYGRAQTDASISLKVIPEPAKYIESLSSMIMDAHNTITAPTDIDLRNILADMLQLINHTCYRLTQI